MIFAISVIVLISMFNMAIGKKTLRDGFDVPKHSVFEPKNLTHPYFDPPTVKKAEEIASATEK